MSPVQCESQMAYNASENISYVLGLNIIFWIDQAHLSFIQPCRWLHWSHWYTMYKIKSFLLPFQNILRASSPSWTWTSLLPALHFSSSTSIPATISGDSRTLDTGNLNATTDSRLGELLLSFHTYFSVLGWGFEGNKQWGMGIKFLFC